MTILAGSAQISMTWCDKKSEKGGTLPPLASTSFAFHVSNFDTLSYSIKYECPFFKKINRWGTMEKTKDCFQKVIWWFGDLVIVYNILTSHRKILKKGVVYGIYLASNAKHGLGTVKNLFCLQRQTLLVTQSSDKKLDSCTNFRRCAKSWFVAQKCFYTV